MAVLPSPWVAENRAAVVVVAAAVIKGDAEGRALTVLLTGAGAAAVLCIIAEVFADTVVRVTVELVGNAPENS